MLNLESDSGFRTFCLSDFLTFLTSLNNFPLLSKLPRVIAQREHKILL